MSTLTFIFSGLLSINLIAGISEFEQKTDIKTSQEELKKFHLELDLSKINMVESYSPGFDYQGFNFYVDGNLLLNAKVIADYPKFPSVTVPNKATLTEYNDISCFKWENNKQYSGECIVKYAYIKKHDLSLYAHFSFMQLSLEDSVTALAIINSTKIKTL